LLLEQAATSNAQTMSFFMRVLGDALVPEYSSSGKDHRNTMIIGCLYDFLVSY
jgi:hypothetical protein